MFASIGEPGNQRTHLVRLEREVNLEKQSQVDAVLRDLLADAVGVDAAIGAWTKSSPSRATTGRG